MASTYQFENMNMLMHGQMVHDAYVQLLKELGNKTEDPDLKLILSEEERKFLLENQYHINLMENYHIYHDCGKPYCRTVDENGKQSFPNHAQISTEIYKQYFNNQVVEILIKYDMHFHILKSEELEIWLKDNKDNPKLLASLYLTAWAELIANSSMFGGYESTSFKIKRKCLIKAGKKLFSLLEKI